MGPLPEQLNVLTPYQTPLPLTASTYQEQTEKTGWKNKINNANQLGEEDSFEKIKI